MKKTMLLHNDGAGHEDYFKSELVQAIEQEGFSCIYFPIKKDNGWKDSFEQIDFAVAAGGDGTVRRVVKELMKKERSQQRIPLAILPLGTANNLSKSLNIDPALRIEEHIQRWKKNNRQSFDLGEILNGDETDYFLEGAGYGVFPSLIRKMDAMSDDRLESVDDKLKFSLQELYKIVLTAEADPFHITANKQIIEGKALLIEVMNIQSVGPNLILSPDAAIDDGVFNLVLVLEEQRKEFLDYIKAMINDEDVKWTGNSLKANRLVINCKSTYIHIDDEVIATPTAPLLFQTEKNALQFLV